VGFAGRVLEQQQGMGPRHLGQGGEETFPHQSEAALALGVAAHVQHQEIGAQAGRGPVLGAQGRDRPCPDGVVTRRQIEQIPSVGDHRRGTTTAPFFAEGGEPIVRPFGHVP
jgi:hypothetical protein